MMTNSVARDWRIQKPVLDLLFIVFSGLAALLYFSALRFFLYLRNSIFANEIPLSEILLSFLMGIRFDMIVVCLSLLPLSLFLLLKNGLGKRRLAMVWLVLIISACLFLGIVELDFYHEFQTRLNYIAVQYLKEDPATVSSMLWHGFPVVRYIALWLVLSCLFTLTIVFIHTNTTRNVSIASKLSLRIVIFIVLLVFLVLNGRGTLRPGPPLRWGDAFHSDYLFANHLPLNATYTFINALRASGHQQKAGKWLNPLTQNQALSVTREMLLGTTDRLLSESGLPILRIQKPGKPNSKIRNVVLILMESFSAEFVGAFGKAGNITPNFDALTKKGVLFTHFFSNGTHTHQGMFASVACFPNLPGYEYLMQQPQGQHNFSGLPVLLKQWNYNDVYVYNGDFSWDNQGGFFRNQGLKNFVGRNDFVNPVFLDPTWGVSDEDMFNRALTELDQLSRNGRPFYAILQTLSNHTPYALPDHLAFEPVTGFGRFDQHLTAQKYSDWALGQFFKKVEQMNYYDDTLFVIVGDHGFGVDEQISGINLLSFHVPLLMIGRDLRQSYGAIKNTVGTQVDIVPTVIGLLGKESKHQCWGRNLFALDEADKGFGIIKPSGGTQTVALIKGNHILVSVDDAPLELGEYKLGPKNEYRTVHDEERITMMQTQLKAYIQTALSALLSNKAGIHPATE